MVSSGGTSHKVRRGSLAHPDAPVVGLCPEGTWAPLSLDYPAPAAEQKAKPAAKKAAASKRAPRDA